jgi:hypothetical protein
MMAARTGEGETPKRNIRVPDDPWFAAKRRARRNGTTVSDLVREFLTDYAHQHETI